MQIWFLVICWEHICACDTGLNSHVDHAEQVGRWPMQEYKEKSVTMSIRWNLAGHHVDMPEGMANPPYVGKRSHHPKLS